MIRDSGFGIRRGLLSSRLRSGAGFTLLELMIVMALISIVAALAMVGLARTRANANEASAINSLRTIQSAEAAFRATCGRGHDYAATLAQLGAAETISPDLVADPLLKAGYLITLAATAPGEAPDTCTKHETASHWYATAVPANPGGAAGHSGFATADDSDIWRDATGAAPREPFAPSPTVSRVGR